MKRVKLNKSKRPKQVIKRKKIPTNPKILKLVKSGIKRENLLKGINVGSAKGNIISQLGGLRDTSSSNVFENSSLLQNMASTIDFNRNALASMNKEKIALRDESRKEIESFKAIDQQYKDLEQTIDARDRRAAMRKDRARELKTLRVDNEKSLEEQRKINKDLFFAETELGLQITSSTYSPSVEVEYREYDLWKRNMENERIKKELEIKQH
jgi:hypothetical protein